MMYSRCSAPCLLLAALASLPGAASDKPGSLEHKAIPVETKATVAAEGHLRFTSFKPDSGSAGDPVLIEGTGLRATTAITIGKLAVPKFLAMDDQHLYALIPPGAASGTFRLSDGKDWQESATAFTVTALMPNLVGISPEHGPAGTRVLLTGTDFAPGMRVEFRDRKASDLTILSPTQALVTVPDGFEAGMVWLLSKDGFSRGISNRFRVTPASAHLTLELAAVTLNQGSQTQGRTVPLVAGRDALLTAVVLADRPNDETPTVRVHLLDAAGKETFTQDIKAPGKGVPQAHDPAALERQWTLVLDGRHLQKGCRLRAELLAAETKAGDATAIGVWPGDGQAAALDLTEVPTLQITLIPVELDGRTGNVDEPPRKLTDWVARFQAMFPVARLEVLKGKPLHCTGSVRADDSSTWEAVARQVEAKRLADGKTATQFYFGVVKRPYERGLGGYGLTGRPYRNEERSAVGLDAESVHPDLAGFQQVFAHELGHTLGCGHAPIGLPDISPTGLDPTYPHQRGDIGAFGWDPGSRSLKPPGSFKDIMGYCPPYWISDHTYQRALEFLEFLGKSVESKDGR
jgi:hypothetical protein